MHDMDYLHDIKCIVSDENQWEELKGGGDRPGGLQEHSMVVHGAKIYVFGGEISFSNATETPLWIYDIQVKRFFKSLLDFREL